MSCSEQEMKSGDVEHDQFADAFGGVDACGNSGVAIRHVEACDILDVVVLTGIMAVLFCSSDGFYV